MAVISFKCPNCDGELIFDPVSQKYKCEYCQSLFSQSELDAANPVKGQETRKEGTEEKGAEEEATVYTCPSCGAQIMTDATTAAAFCYYCHNPVVLGRRLEGSFLPDKVLPFEVSREQAEKGFLDYVGKRKFVPKAFFSKKQIESLSGIYFPYWMYEVELDGCLQGDARQIRVWRSGDTEYTETKHYAVERAGELKLSNLTENALKKVNGKLAAGVMPYRFDRIKDFHMGFLSGFLAERRDIEQTEVREKMQSEMREHAKQLLRETVNGYDSVSVRNMNFKPIKERLQYVLLPVWTITYKGKDGKVYYYSMNGQTGKVCGELPLDYGKLTLSSILAGAGALILVLIGGFFL